MSEKAQKLVLTKKAPEEITITFGTEFKRTFNRKDEPFAVEKKYAAMLLRSYAETFEKAKDKPVETKKAAELTDGKK